MVYRVKDIPQRGYLTRRDANHSGVKSQAQVNAIVIAHILQPDFYRYISPYRRRRQGWENADSARNIQTHCLLPSEGRLTPGQRQQK